MSEVLFCVRLYVVDDRGHFLFKLEVFLVYRLLRRREVLDRIRLFGLFKVLLYSVLVHRIVRQLLRMVISGLERRLVTLFRRASSKSLVVNVNYQQLYL